MTRIGGSRNVLLILSCTVLVECGPEDPAQSLNPFYTEDAVVEAPELVGNWLPILSDGEDHFQLNQSPWHFEHNELRIPRFQAVGDLDNVPAVFFRTGNALFLDLFPVGERTGFHQTASEEIAEKTLSEFWWSMHLRPTHVVYRVHISDDRNHVQLEPLGRDAVEEAIRDDPGISGDTTCNVLTRTSESWMAFLETHAEDDEAFKSAHWYLLLAKYGQEVVLSRHSNGTPELVVSPESRLFANGVSTQENTFYELQSDGRVETCTLARRWRSPHEFDVPAGTRIAFQTSGELEYAELADDWTAPNGMLLQAGTIIRFFEDGQLDSGCLAQTWSSPRGLVLNSGSKFMFFENGELRMGTLAQDWSAPNGLVLQAGSAFEFQEGGLLRNGTLARDWTAPNGPVLLAGSTFEFFESGSLEHGTLARDWTAPNGPVLLAGSTISYFENGQLSSCTLAKDWVSPSGFVAKANTDLSYLMNGDLYHLTLRDPWQAPDGRIYEANKKIDGPFPPRPKPESEPKGNR